MQHDSLNESIYALIQIIRTVSERFVAGMRSEKIPEQTHSLAPGPMGPLTTAAGT